MELKQIECPECKGQCYHVEPYCCRELESGACCGNPRYEEIPCTKCGGMGEILAEVAPGKTKDEMVLQGLEDEAVRREMINGSPIQ